MATFFLNVNAISTPVVSSHTILKFVFRSVSKYLLGSGERFFINVLVENRGEDAFEAMYNLQIPPGMNFINIEKVDSDRSVLVQCSAPTSQNNNILRCDIGNPFPREKLVSRLQWQKKFLLPHALLK